MADQGDFKILSIDGGVFTNDPGLCAYVEAIKAGAAPDRILLVSLGTGYQNRPFSYRDVRDWGPWGWINPRTRQIIASHDTALNEIV